jgi:F-type H+-transporting ATPase subunit delta
MPNSRREDRVLETYARSLMENAKAEGRVFRDLQDLECVANASPEVIAVLGSLFERGQLDLLPQIVASFKGMTEEDEDVVGVTVTTAVPLDDELRRTITEKCEGDLGRKVFLIEKVDPSIMGGLILEARGQRRDVSVKTQLRAAREALVSTNIQDGGEA